MRRGPVIRCLFAGALATLLLLSAHQAYAATTGNPPGIAVHPDAYWGDDSFGSTDYSGDWRPYCSSGKTNTIRWYTGDGTLRSQSSPMDCAIGMGDNASPGGVPGAITLWGFGSSIIPASLPHNFGNFGGDGDFYFTITSASSTYSTPASADNPAGISIQSDAYWGDGSYGATDYSLGWQPYCTSGSTNVVRWYTADGVLRSQSNPLDCAVGMGDNASPRGIPGAISVWGYGSSIIPASLPHNFGGSNFGGDADFYLTLTNGSSTVYRYDFGWHTSDVVHRFDWSWHIGTGYSFPSASPTLPLETATVTVPVIIIPGIMGSAQHNGTWVIDPITHGFDNLIDTLVVNGYTKEVNLFTFPYDWHKSNVDTAILLKQKIDAVKTACSCDKVDLVAHSMGGLVARQYIQSDSYAHDVRNMIFIGTPHLGAPEAYLLWEGGDVDTTPQNQKMKVYLFAEALKHGFTNLFNYIRNTPITSVQQLLPVYGYLKHTVTLDTSPYPNTQWYPSNTFLESLDDNVASLIDSGVTITNYVGQLPINATITKIRVTPPSTISATSLWGHGIPEGFNDRNSADNGLERGIGDDIVPLSSSSFINVNLHVLDANHGDLITQAEGAIFRVLTNRSAYSLITARHDTDAPAAIFSLLSPADIVVIAPDGKRIGKDFATGQEVNEIPDAFYSGFQTDEEYVTIPNPEPGTYKVITQGTGIGGKYRLVTGIAGNATSSEAIFTGQTLPGLITEHDVTINTARPDETKIAADDVTAPSIVFAQPATTTYTHADFVPIKLSFTDSTGIATSSASFDKRLIAASSTVDLFYETLGTHIITASSTDLVNNSATSKMTIQVIATASSTISDIQREFALGWIKKDLRDQLVKKIEQTQKLQKITDTIIVSTKPKLVTKKVDRWVSFFDKILLKTMLLDLSLAKNKKAIAEQGYQLLVTDTNWLLNH